MAQFEKDGAPVLSLTAVQWEPGSLRPNSPLAEFSADPFLMETLYLVKGCFSVWQRVTVWHLGVVVLGVVVLGVVVLGVVVLGVVVLGVVVSPAERKQLALQLPQRRLPPTCMRFLSTSTEHHF